MDQIENMNIGAMGDPTRGRPTLGTETSVLTYRLIRIVTMNILKSQNVESEPAIYDAGAMVGGMIYLNMIKSASSLDDFVKKATKIFLDLKVGKVIVEEVRTKGELFIRLKVDECVSCSGTPNIGKAVCQLEAGLIAGLISAYLGSAVQAKEVKCWGLGDKTCEFEITPA